MLVTRIYSYCNCACKFIIVDEELLKMELQEEKNREANEKKKKLKEQSANKLAIKHEEILNKMTYAEREALAVKYIALEYNKQSKCRFI